MLSSMYALLALAAETTGETLAPVWSWQAVLKLVCVVATTFLAPLVLAGFLTRRWKMPDYFNKLALVLFVLFASASISVFGWHKIKLGIDLGGGSILVYEIEEGGLDKVRQDDSAAKGGKPTTTKETKVDMGALCGAISKRVNPGGVREVSVRPYGPRQIEITIPEADKTEVDRIQEKISRIGTLEFRILATRNRPEYEALMKRAESLLENETELRSKTGDVLAKWVPVQQGQEKSFERSDIARRAVTLDNQQLTEVLVVQDLYNVTGGYLTKAYPTQDDKFNRAVGFTFDSRGAQLFGGLTGEHQPDATGNFEYQLGVLLDGYLYSAPSLRDKISSSGIITGSFTEEEVKQQVDVLNAGALPTALSRQPINRMSTDTTLGKDTIRTGLIAVGVSVALVFAFMLVYYRFSGVVACAALAMNILVLLAIMISIKAAFTLPGLAGLALTIGMAVDANVLIYERIREELERGASIRMAIRNGFERAQSAIVDSNLTTMIAAAVLWYIGSDQIKGFAITLLLGLSASLFTAVFCAHVVFDIADRRHWITKLTMMRMFSKTNIDFWGVRFRCYAGSLIVIAIGLIGVGFRIADGSLLDIDFTGGVSMQVVFTKEPEGKIEYVRKALADAKLDDLVVKNVTTADQGDTWRVMIDCSSPKTESGDPKNASDFLKEIEEKVRQTFGDKLVTNSAGVSDVQAVSATPATPRKEPAAKDASPKGPAAKEQTQSRNDLPPSTWLASADPALALAAAVLAQAKPAPALAAAPTPAATKPTPAATKPAPAATKPAPAAEKPETKSAPAPEAKSEAKPEAKAPVAEKPAVKAQAEAAVAAPAEKPAVAPAADTFAARFAKGAQAKITFTQPVTRDEVKQMIDRELDRTNRVASAVDKEITRPDFRQGDKKAYADWELKINLPPDSAKEILDKFVAANKNITYFPSSNTIGGKVASDTRRNAVYAMILSNVLIMLYLWVRFQRLMYGVAAVVALVHDVLVTMGLLALMKWAAPMLGFLLVDPFKIGLTEVAAFLTLVGFSVNDTVVVFDRIREVKGKSQAVTPKIINTSINQTLSRTILTSLTVLIVSIMLYIFGGPTIHGFSFLMVTGIITGAYSSVYVAAPLLLFGKKEPSQAGKNASGGGRS